MTARHHEELRRRLERQTQRRSQAEREAFSLLGSAMYFGSLGLLFVVPVAAGAYVGLWLDSRMAGYSVVWTLTLLLAGVCVGAVNVYLFVRRTW